MAAICGNVAKIEINSQVSDLMHDIASSAVNLVKLLRIYMRLWRLVPLVLQLHLEINEDTIESLIWEWFLLVFQFWPILTG